MKLDRQFGLPAIVPSAIYNQMFYEHLESVYIRDRRMVVALISVICIFRVLPTKPKPDLSSITGGFTGISRILDSDKVTNCLKELNIKLKLRFRD